MRRSDLSFWVLAVAGAVCWLVFTLGRLHAFPFAARDGIRLGDTVVAYELQQSYDGLEHQRVAVIKRLESIDKTVEGYKVLGLREIGRLPVL